jgi:hypothetical protein
LIIEALIAIFLDDRIIRPYVGDFLVVILIYCFLRTFFKIGVWIAAVGTLLFAYAVELLQYLDFIHFIGFQNNRLANIILGNRFEWIDMIAYTAGVMVVFFVEIWRTAK